MKKSRTRVVVTAIPAPRRLAWVIRDDKDLRSALSAPLEHATVTDDASTPGYRMLPDKGVIVEGVLTGMLGMRGSACTSYIFTLGGEPPAARFKQSLFQAVQALKK